MLKVYNLLSICLEIFSSGKHVFENQELSMDVSVDWENFSSFASSIWFFFSKNHKQHRIKNTDNCTGNMSRHNETHFLSNTKKHKLGFQNSSRQMLFPTFAFFGQGVVEKVDFVFCCPKLFAEPWKVFLSLLFKYLFFSCIFQCPMFLCLRLHLLMDLECDL